MARLHPRLRKSFRLTKHLKATISKRGMSLNFKWGPIAWSRGTGGRRLFAVDAPGTLGLGWRKQEQRSPTPQQRARFYAVLWGTVCLLILCVETLIGLARLYVHPFGECTRQEGLLEKLLTYMGIEVAVWLGLWIFVPRFRGPLAVVFLLVAGYVQYRMYGAYIAPNITCVPK